MGLEDGHAQALVADRPVGVIRKAGGRERAVGIRVFACVLMHACAYV